MSEPQRSGAEGEDVVRALLGYEGWEIEETQPLAMGHRVDFLASHPAYGQALIEVKVWARGGGTDTVKKAIADAYDLREAGETRPYFLILSHALDGLYGEMLRRARKSGAIARVIVLKLQDYPEEL